MRDLLVVVLEVRAERLRAHLADVDRPGEVERRAAVERGPDLVADAAAVLAPLAGDDLAARLLALAVAVGPGLPQDEVAPLLTALTGGGSELAPGWPLPAALPVLTGAAADWQAQGAAVAAAPLVAGAVVAAARWVGAHAHLPHP